MNLDRGGLSKYSTHQQQSGAVEANAYLINGAPRSPQILKSLIHRLEVLGTTYPALLSSPLCTMFLSHV